MLHWKDHIAGTQVTHPDVAHSTLFAIGGVVESIISTAHDGKSDLIIIGATDKPLCYQQLLGGTADEIVKRAPCNVLIVRTKRRS